MTFASNCGTTYRRPWSCASRVLTATLSGEKPVSSMSRSTKPEVPISTPVRRASLKMFVLTTVGHSTVTLISVPLSSAARVSDRDMTPALDTLYEAIEGPAANPAAEATLMIGRTEQWREQFAAVDDAPQVDTQRPLPVVHADLADRLTADSDARIVDHQRGRPREHLLRLEDQLLHLISR
ncbi:Uncharacterised protein [Mycobacteroides abscessus subsp. massiliense]|nr:Uncharacterised protein [Mycobacteroides abscessus subsp. massiliense]